MPPDLAPNNAIYSEVTKAQGHLNLRPVLSNFKFPTLIINGRFDMNEPVITAWQTYKAIPGAQLVVFEKSGHLPFYEEPRKIRESGR
jgi:proline iminopeptidase